MWASDVPGLPLPRPRPPICWSATPGRTPPRSSPNLQQRGRASHRAISTIFQQRRKRRRRRGYSSSGFSTSSSSTLTPVVHVDDVCVCVFGLLISMGVRACATKRLRSIYVLCVRCPSSRTPVQEQYCGGHAAAAAYTMMAYWSRLSSTEGTDAARAKAATTTAALQSKLSGGTWCRTGAHHIST